MGRASPALIVRTEVHVPAGRKFARSPGTLSAADSAMAPNFLAFQPISDGRSAVRQSVVVAGLVP